MIYIFGEVVFLISLYDWIMFGCFNCAKFKFDVTGAYWCSTFYICLIKVETSKNNFFVNL